MGEITELRKSGQLKAAYELAKTKIQNEADNHYLKSEFGWVLWEYLKQNRGYQQRDTFLKILEELLQLNLPDFDTMLGNQVVFQAVPLMWEAGNKKEADRELILKMLRKLARLPMSIPGEAYSALLKTAVRHLENGADQMRFIEWWNLEQNLQHIDFQKEHYQERKLPSLAERAASAVYKNLTQADANGNALYDKTILQKYLRWFETLAPKHPEMEYLSYYISKLKLLLGDTEGELERILPFIRKKRNATWAWHHLAQFCPDAHGKKACLAKGLTIRAQESFYVTLRLDLAKILIAEKAYPQAKFEIEKILKLYQQEGWNLKMQLQQLSSAKWFQETEAAKSNPYKDWANKAETLLISDAPQIFGIIVSLNYQKKQAQLILSGRKVAYADFRLFAGKTEPGDRYLFTVKKMQGKNGVWYKALASTPTNQETDPEIEHSFTEKLQLKENQKGDKFAIAGDTYIPPALLEKQHFKDGEAVKGLAVAHFNSQKQQWGWQAISIEKTNPE
ncbi:MAG TPA: hypothetical protein ENN84_02620 [Candidatus Marinimicrobia bacterium]|nr:hypothetical protein [Candidatus Neomarinimicrobiota bacterium]